MPIVKIPNQVLTKPADEVKSINPKIREIVREMKKTLLAAKRPKGVGLAAPQVGIPLRIFITKPEEKSPIGVFINPEITEKSDEMGEIEREGESRGTTQDENRLEGCLSIPKIWGHLKRHRRVRLKYLDETGKPHEEEYTGFMATIIQHETDHVNGILFTQRVLEQNEKLYEIERNKEGKEELVEIEI